MEKALIKRFQEFVIQHTQSLKSPFSVKELMKKIPWKSPEFQQIFGAMVEEAFLSEHSNFVRVGTSKDHLPVFLSKDDLMVNFQTAFCALPFILSETEVQRALQSVSHMDQVDEQALIRTISSQTVLIRFDQGSRGKPIALNVYKRYLLPGKGLLITSSVFNHYMMQSTAAPEIDGKGKLRKEKMKEEDPKKSIYSAVSCFLEDIRSLVFPISELKSIHFKRYFSIDDPQQTSKIFQSLYPEVFQTVNGIWSFFPEMWLDLKQLCEKGSSGSNSRDEIEQELHARHPFLNEQEIIWIMDGVRTDRRISTVLPVQPLEDPTEDETIEQPELPTVANTYEQPEHDEGQILDPYNPSESERSSRLQDKDPEDPGALEGMIVKEPDDSLSEGITTSEDSEDQFVVPPTEINEKEDLLQDLLIGFTEPEKIEESGSEGKEESEESLSPEPIHTQQVAHEQGGASEPIISIITDNSELFEKAKSLALKHHFRLRDSLAYQPNLAVLDQDYEYLAPIAKSSGVPVLSVQQFLERYPDQ